MRTIFSMFLLLGVIAWSTAGCVPVVATAAATGGYLVGKDERTLEQISLDAAITAQVKAGFVRDDRIRAFAINVDTYESIVTLRGEVETAAEQKAAEEIARKVEGVKDVHSELRIVPVKVEDRS